jgi:dolichol-phosphate mannosyltransferase
VHLLKRANKRGLASAYLEGFRQGLDRGYPFICEMDADFSHQPQYLHDLLRAVREGADVALGSRYVYGGRVEGWGWSRHLLSRSGSLYARALLRLPVCDCTTGFKCFRSHVLEQIDFAGIRSNGYAFQIEMNYLAHQMGFQLQEVPIVFPDRTAGKSKMSWRIALEAAGVVWKLRQDQGRHRSRPLSSRAPQP